MSSVKIIERNQQQVRIIFSSEKILFYVRPHLFGGPSREYYAPEVKDIIITGEDKKNFSLLSLLPRGIKTVCPTPEEYPDDSLSNFYSSYQKVLVIKSLAEKGDIFSVLHEIGHTHTWTRYERKYDQDYDNLPSVAKVLIERSAWGWALDALNSFRRLGVDFEPTMSIEETKEIVRFSLVAHEVGKTYDEFMDNPALRKDLTYWKSIKKNELDKLIDDLFANSDFGYDKDDKTEFKKVFTVK